jgi:hypothetical protein
MPISDLVDFEEDEGGGKGERQNAFSKYIRVSVAWGCMSLSFISWFLRFLILQAGGEDAHSSTPPLSSTYTSRRCTTPMSRRVGRPRILSRASASGFCRRLKVW